MAPDVWLKFGNYNAAKIPNLLSFFQDPVASGSGPQPFAFAFSKPAANTSAITIGTTFRAGSKGTAFIAKWVIKAGAGTFKTL